PARVHLERLRGGRAVRTPRATHGCTAAGAVSWRPVQHRQGRQDRQGRQLFLGSPPADPLVTNSHFRATKARGWANLRELLSQNLATDLPPGRFVCYTYVQYDDRRPSCSWKSPRETHPCPPGNAGAAPMSARSTWTGCGAGTWPAASSRSWTATRAWRSRCSP